MIAGMLRCARPCLSRRPAALARPRFWSATAVCRLASPYDAPSFHEVQKWGSRLSSASNRQAASKPTLSPEEQAQNKKRLQSMRTCTALTSDPKSTSLQALLDCIPKLDPDAMRSEVACFLLLVTPSYASSIRTQQDVIQNTINRIYPLDVHAAHKAKVHVFSAVVDRIPEPTSSHAPPVGNTGSEGLAFMFNDTNPYLQMDHLHQRPRPSNTHDPAPRTITFVSELASSRQPTQYSIEVPLANTIFQNGLPATLIHSRYINQHGTLFRQSTDHVDHQTFWFPDYPSPREGDHTMSIPLVPLTQARSVVACMGNIVRRLSSDASLRSRAQSEEAILASQELEQSVTSYFKARNLSPQPVSVWALIVPKALLSSQDSMVTNQLVDSPSSSHEDSINSTRKASSGGRLLSQPTMRALWPQNLIELWEKISSNGTSPSAPDFMVLLSHGARLHKVLSGGGGWGKKAGLLALDPDLEYKARDSSPEDVPASSPEHYPPEGPLAQILQGLQESSGPGLWETRPPTSSRAEDNPTGLRNTIEPGDYIQFYIAPISSSERQPTPPFKRVSTPPPFQGSPDSRSAEFGTIPSTVDEMPSHQQTPNAGEGFIDCYAHHFGALSEIGVGLSFGDVLNAHFSHHPFYQTKVDVPFGRFRLQSSKNIEAPPLGFAPTVPRKSIMSSHAMYWRDLAEQSGPEVINRRSLHASCMYRDGENGSPPEDTVWQGAHQNAITSRQLKLVERIPRWPNKNWTSKDINQARRATNQDRKTKAEAKKISRRVSTREPTFGEIYSKSLTSEWKKTLDTRTLETLISAEAFQAWEKSKRVPKHPVGPWSSSDIRDARRFLKSRQDRKGQEKLNHLRPELDAYETSTPFKEKAAMGTARRRSRTRYGLTSGIDHTLKDLEDAAAEEDEEEEQPKKAKRFLPTFAEQKNTRQPPIIAALKQQVIDRVRARMLHTAFRGLLSNYIDRRLMSRARARSQKMQYNVQDTVLDRRVIDFLTIRQHNPRITVFTLVDPIKRPKTRKYPSESFSEVFKERLTQKRRKDMRRRLTRWRLTAEALRREMEAIWPGKQKAEEKRMLDEELEEIDSLEASVVSFLSGR